MSILTPSFCFGDGFDVATRSLGNPWRKAPDIAAVYLKSAQRITLAISLF
jgi:hypothetical protein